MALNNIERLKERKTYSPNQSTFLKIEHYKDVRFKKIGNYLINLLAAGEALALVWTLIDTNTPSQNYLVVMAMKKYSSFTKAPGLDSLH